MSTISKINFVRGLDRVALLLSIPIVLFFGHKNINDAPLTKYKT